MKISEFLDNESYMAAVCLGGDLEYDFPSSNRRKRVARKYLQEILHKPKGAELHPYRGASNSTYWNREAGIRKVFPDGTENYYPLAGHCDFWGSGADWSTNTMFRAASKLCETHN